ncbi:MAG: AbrB/MazE/SpoVT family DNA-binding domain-containing protein [Nitrososphaerales archaeon]
MGTKEYNKWIIVIPPEDIEKLKWREGQELELEIQEGKLILSAKGMRR